MTSTTSSTPYPQIQQSTGDSLSIFSNHLLQQDIIKKSIKPFNGSPCEFWPWVGKIKSYITGLSLSPLQTLQLLESHSTGSPQLMISQQLASTGEVNHHHIEDVWDSLIQRYGSSQQIANQLIERIDKFKPIKPPNQGEQMQELYDLCKVVLYNQQRCQDLTLLNMARGLERVRIKLPDSTQSEWQKFGQSYEDTHFGQHPPFSKFVDFIKLHAKQQSNNNYVTLRNIDKSPPRKGVRALHTTLSKSDNFSSTTHDRQIEKNFCLYHKLSGHLLHECKVFKTLSYPEKKKFLFESKLCFSCLGEHLASNCESNPRCEECGGKHVTSLHKPVGTRYNQKPYQQNSLPRNNNYKNKDNQPKISTIMCTSVCQSATKRNDCSKTLLVELTMEGHDDVLLGYAILDEQSNTSLVDEKVLSFFGRNFPTQDFSMKFASQNFEVSSKGQLVTGLHVRGFFENEVIDIPTALSCSNIANTKNEVATPNIVRTHRKIAHYAQNFPEFQPEAEVLLLIGRNCGRAMATQCLNETEPYVHKTPLGYALVGNTCTDTSNDTRTVRVLKTNCISHVPIQVRYNFSPKPSSLEFDTFARSSDDEIPGLSTEDRRFLNMMQCNIKTTLEGNLELPLPLKPVKLPKNGPAVFHRTKNTLTRLKTQPAKLKSALQSMEKSLASGFVESVPQSEQNSEHSQVWYNPIFTVDQPKKQKVRLVHDASARFNGVSLNDVLYQGPDLNNQLRGVLLRFREHPIAFSADIESMHNTFKVPQDQKDLLRFFWFEQNDPNRNIIPYRSTSHIFGCTSSPAVATFAMKYCADQPLPLEYKDAQEYIRKSFYVDDGIMSTKTTNTAIQILSKAIEILNSHNIRLHKIVSNSKIVLDNFPASEKAPSTNKLPTDASLCQQTLGVKWDTSSDDLVVTTMVPSKPFNRRGILSVVNSMYDPMGLISPVVLTGRLIQRKLLPAKHKAIEELEDIGWDTILPEQYRPQWEQWIQSLSLLNEVRIPRSFYPQHFNPDRQELHVFCDASDVAIGHAAYLRSLDKSGNVHVAFVNGSSRVTPRCATSIPRLELNAAMEASKYTSFITAELDRKPDDVYMHSDSRIVLAYISGTHRRFSKYIERRVSIILDHTEVRNWHYVATHDNPADIATRQHTPHELLVSSWFKGPYFLLDKNYEPPARGAELTNELPEEKNSLEAKILLVKKHPTNCSPFKETFTRIGSLNKLANVATLVLKFVRKIDIIKQRKGVILAPRNPLVDREEALQTLIFEAQKEKFSDVIWLLKHDKQLPESHPISKLTPYVDLNDILRVGGRLINASIPFCAKHPALLPKDHPLSVLVASHYHVRTKHQGTHLSHGSVIQAGFHIENGRQLIARMVKECVHCRKLRATTSTQLMSDLPPDRLEELPPFQNVGIDVFGPFYIHDGINTRRSNATKKIWCLIFVCLPSRAIHIEPLVCMDSSSFRNALTRFFAIRGTSKFMRSDQGSNFMCTKRQIEAIDMKTVTEEMSRFNVKWIVNPPHASHFGGSWERKIGSVRRVLEGSMQLCSNRCLSRDEFSTLLTEASQIVNNTPLWTVPNHPDDPFPLTPAMLLTLRESPNADSKEEYSENDLMSYGKLRYRRVRFLSEMFWSRWRQEYLQDLTKRHKWKTRTPCISSGDIVLIRDKQASRNTWPMGRVLNAKKSSDGLVRSAIIQIPPQNGKFRRNAVRAISDLVLLIPSSSHAC